MLLVREVVELANHRTVLIVKAALLGPILPVRVTQMPFPDDGGVVSGLSQRLWHEPFVCCQAVGAHRWDDQGLQSVAERIAPGHQRRPRGRTHRLCVELFQPRTRRSEPVNVRRLDIRAAIETDILPAEIVGNDMNDVGLR